MSGVTLALSEGLWQSLVDQLRTPVESAGVMAAGLVVGPAGDLSVLGRSLRWVADDAYDRRDVDQMVIASPAWVPLLGAAAADGTMAVFVHTHPGALAYVSGRDRIVDDALAGPFRIRTGQPRYGHIVLGGAPEAPEVDGRFLDRDGSWRELRAVRVVGRRLKLVVPDGHTDARHDPATFDRQVRAYGGAGQRVLHALHVGVVGAGGTGSAVAEQLARLGIGRLTLIDPKDLTAGNITRVYGSTMDDVGRPKVEVLAEHLRRMGLGTDVHTVRGSVTERDAAGALRHCDVVFGCTDDEGGRLVLSRLGYWYLMPVVDMGVVVDTGASPHDDLEVTGIYGRVTVVGPGAACLLCRGRIDLRLARAERLEPAERERLAAEGYARGLGEPDPSVVSFTTLTAATAVSELLERLFGYGVASAPSEQILRLHHRRVSTNTAAPRAACYCVDADVLAAGDRHPFLGLTWT
ncbi:MAG: HesA/MoeB/ThiF family protein [Acidimicrobiales bacterium]